MELSNSFMTKINRICETWLVKLINNILHGQTGLIQVILVRAGPVHPIPLRAGGGLVQYRLLI